MKIVINRCYGGFGLSPQAIKRLVMKKSELVKKFPLKAWEQDFRENPTDIGDGFKVPSVWYTGAIAKGDTVYCIDETKRSHPDLVSVVEEMGRDAWGKYAKLKVVEIPDGVDWEIEEYDGVERIVEKRRAWV